MKILVDAKTDTVIGVHMIGPDCAEIMQVSLAYVYACSINYAFCNVFDQGFAVLCCCGSAFKVQCSRQVAAACRALQLQ